MDYDKSSKSQAFTFPDANQSQNTRFFKNLTATPSFPNATSSVENYFFSNQNSFQYQSQAYNQNHHNYHQQQQAMQQTSQLPPLQPSQQLNGQTNGVHNNSFNSFSRQRFTPYYNKRSYANALMQQQQQQTNPQRYYNYISQQFDLENGNVINANSCIDLQANVSNDFNNNSISLTPNQNQSSYGNASVLNSSVVNGGNRNGTIFDSAANGNSCVTLQISNLDTSIDERSLKQYLIGKLKPITSVLSIYFESISVAKIKLPSAYHAKQVIAFLHRKKIGHKRITVSYTRESSSTEPSTLRCQVAGLLKVNFFR